MLQDNRFVPGVGSLANGAHTVECRNAKRRGEVAVGCAAGCCFVQFESEFRGQRPGLAIELDRAAGALHGRAIDAAGDGERAAFVTGFEGYKFAIDARSVRFAGDAHVDLGPGFGGNDVGFAASAGKANTHGEPALEIGPAADGFDQMGQFADRAGALLEVNARVGRDALDVDAPVAGALARGFVSQTQGRFQNVDGGALGSQTLCDGARDGAADLFVTVEQQNDFAIEKGSLREQFDGRKCHGHTGFHVQGAGTEQAALRNTKGHGLESAKGPDRIQMAEQEDGLCGASPGSRPEAGFEDITESPLAVNLDVAAQSPGMGGSKGYAGVNGGFVVRGRLSQDQLADLVEQRGLAAPGSGQKGAHGDWGV